MTLPYQMVRARLGDLDTVMRLLDSRIRWLRERGTDQWNTGTTFRMRMTNHIDRGETWLLFDDESAIATVTVGTDGDPDFWSPEELRDKAVYVSKMASRIERSGEGLGALMIRWVQDWAARSDLDTVRWDAWRTNPQLQDYYRSIGARHVRTVDVADRWSGALFEVPARVAPSLGEQVVADTGRRA